MRYNRKGSFKLTKIFLIRHAEAEGNIYRRAHGHFNGQITGNGFRQIELLKQRFEGVKIDAVYSSDLSRAKTTAAAIYVPHTLALYEDQGLREVNVGSWEDRAWGNLLHEYPEMSECFGSDPDKWRTEGSEPYAHVRERMTDSILSIARRHDGETAAIFSHGFAIRTFLCGVLGVKSDESYKVPYCDNTAVTLLSFDRGVLSVDYLGDNSHLTDDSSTFAYQTWWRDEKDRRSEDMRYELSGEAVSFTDVEAGRKSYTAYLEDEQAGQLELDFTGGAGESSGWIRNIYIRPDFRRRRYGIQLIGQAVSDSRRLRREKLQMSIPNDSPDLGFFLKCGFTNTGGSDSSCLLQMNVRNW